MRKTRILASLLCVMMIVCAIPMMQASAAVTPDGVDFAPTTILYDDFNDSVISDYTLTGNKTAEIATVDGENKAVKITTTTGTGLRISNSAFALDNKDVSIRFKLKLGGNSGVTDEAASYYIQPQISLGANQQAKPTIGLSNVSLTKDTWYDILIDFDAATGDNATTGYQTASAYYRNLEENGTPADWTTVIYTVSEAQADGHSNKIDFWLPTSNKQLATEAWIDDVHVYTQEEAPSPDGVNYNPVLVFGENFEDGYIGDYTYTGTKTAVAENGAIRLTNDTANGAGLQIADDAFANLNDKSFSLKFRMKLGGDGATTGSLPSWFIQPQLSFGSNQQAKNYIGYNNVPVKKDIWYEVVYDFAPATDAGTGYQSADVYYRQNDSGIAYDWTKVATVTEAAANGHNNKLLFWLPAQSGNERATDVWLDDIQVYLHESVDAVASPDGVTYKPVMIFEDNFDNGSVKTGWTGADSATFEDGAIKLGKDSAISYADAKFGELNDKSFSFRFKTKVSGNTSETPDKNWVRPELAFGTDQWISTYLGYNSDSVLKQDMWYEFVYDYEPTTDAATGYQTATIYYRYSLDKKAWTAWKTAKSVTEVLGSGSTNRIRLSFSDVASNLATSVMYDDIQVYLHEEDVPVEPGIPGGGSTSTVGPDGWVNPLVKWEDDFSDNDISDWQYNTGFEVVDVDGNKMLHADAANDTIYYSNNSALQLKDKNFTLRFKMKLDLPEGGTGYNNLAVAFGNYTTDKTKNLGWSGLGMTDECWYEWAYVYSYDADGTDRVDTNGNPVTGTQTLDIWSRYQYQDGTWTDWVVREEDVPVAKYNGAATMLKFTYPEAANQQATDVWYDNFQVYLHEDKASSLPVNPKYADKVSASLERYLDDVTLVVTDKEGYEGTVEGLTMYLATYDIETTILKSIRKITGTNGAYEVTLPEENFELFLWDATLSPVFNAISE